MKFTAIALDLDGTALNNAHALADETVEKIRSLSSRGVLVMIATGRSAPAVYTHVLRLNLPVPLPCVLYNGAVGCTFPPSPTRPAEQMVELFRDKLPQAAAQRIIDLGNSLSLCVQYYVADRIYCYTSTDDHAALTKRYRDLTGAAQIQTSDSSLSEAISDSPSPEKILIMCDDVESTFTSFKKSLSTTTVNIIKGGFFVEILNASKGSGLAKICESHLSLDIANVVAFGDGFNDLEFIQLSGYGVAMKNGRDPIKDIAKVITEFTNEELGVVKELERLESLGLL